MNFLKDLMEKPDQMRGGFMGKLHSSCAYKDTGSSTQYIPPKKCGYLAEIAETMQLTMKWVKSRQRLHSQYYQLDGQKLLPDAEKYIGETEKPAEEDHSVNLELIHQLVCSSPNVTKKNL